MPDWLTPEQRSRNMAAIRSSGTMPETQLRAVLRAAFPRRHLRERPRLPGHPDFYLPGLRLAIFADGCFWHGCPIHGHIPDDNRDYWGPKLSRTAERDEAAKLALHRMGITTLRFWEHELRAAATADVISRLLRSAPPG
ncbi:MAG: very short patch repair endonuclease [Candidatus Dormiibacterota bacterium]|jgi:DNA mismatch endonuclease (patch repair protein)